MATAIIAAIALLSGAVESPSINAVAVVRDVVVTGSGDPRNLPFAGLYAPYLMLEATNRLGETTELYLLRMDPADPYPPLGGLCAFDVESQALLPGRLVETFRDSRPASDGEIVLVIQHFECQISSDSPVIVADPFS